MVYRATAMLTTPLYHAGNVRNYSNIATVSGTQTFTDKTISASLNVISVGGININLLLGQDVRDDASPTFHAVTTTTLHALDVTASSGVFTDFVQNYTDNGPLTLATSGGNADVVLSPDGTGAVTMVQGSDTLMKLSLVSGNNTLRLGKNSANPNLTLGDSTGTDGPLLARAASAGDYMSNAGAGDMVVRNNDAGIQIGTSPSVADITVAAGNAGVTVSTGLTVANSNTGPDLAFPQNTKDDKLVLYQGPSAKQIYGFGVGAGALQYRVDQTTSDHVFLAGLSSITENELLRVKGTGGVRFTGNTTSGYSATTLNYYEEGSYTATFAGTVSTSQTIKYNRIGNRVTVQVPAFSAAAIASSYIYDSSKALPLRMRPPAGTVGVSVLVTNNSATVTTPGILTIGSDGSLQISAPGVPFTASGTAGLPNTVTATYLL